MAASSSSNRSRSPGKPYRLSVLQPEEERHPERNTVERLINKLKAWRGIATRYDKTPESYLAGLHLRASMIWITDLLRTEGQSNAPATTGS